MFRRVWKILCLFMLLMAFALLFSACERELAEDGGELVQRFVNTQTLSTRYFRLCCVGFNRQCTALPHSAALP